MLDAGKNQAILSCSAGSYPTSSSWLFPAPFRLAVANHAEADKYNITLEMVGRAWKPPKIRTQDVAESISNTNASSTANLLRSMLVKRSEGDARLALACHPAQAGLSRVHLCKLSQALACTCPAYAMNLPARLSCP